MSYMTKWSFDGGTEMIIKSGDRLQYIADVHPDYTGMIATAKEFDLENRILNLEFADGVGLWVFWNEVILQN